MNDINKIPIDNKRNIGKQMGEGVTQNLRKIKGGEGQEENKGGTGSVPIFLNRK